MKWRVECWNCNEGELEYGCDCQEDCCVCLEPNRPRCDICKGKGFNIVTELTDDNCESAIRVE